MELVLKSRNGVVSDSIREYATKKVRKLNRYFHTVDSAHMEEATERGLHIVELVVEADGIMLRSEDRCGDLIAAVDNVVNKMERQIKNFKARLRKGHQRPGPVKEAVAESILHMAEFEESDESEDSDELSPKIVRRKRFQMKPMSADEAAQRMELVDHSFFLFHNQDSDDVNLLYRRRDGNYGLIEPDR